MPGIVGLITSLPRAAAESQLLKMVRSAGAGFGYREDARRFAQEGQATQHEATESSDHDPRKYGGATGDLNSGFPVFGLEDLERKNDLRIAGVGSVGFLHLIKL